MKKYIATQTLELFSGLIGLSDKQAKPRMGSLSPVKKRKGCYEITAPVQFKAGEIVKLADVDKATWTKVEEFKTEAELKAEAEAAEKAKAEAQAKTEEEAEADKGNESGGILNKFRGNKE